MEIEFPSLIFRRQAGKQLKGDETVTTKTQPKLKTRPPIKAGETLLLSDFLHRANLGRTAWRTVRDNCDEMKITIVTYAVGQAYVATDKWLEYLSKCDTHHKSTRERRK